MHFDTPSRLTASEVKRLSPAAMFSHSMIGVWPDAEGFAVWGILNSGPRWMNRASGGRRTAQAAHPYPVVQIRDPGVLGILLKDSLLAELRGLTLHQPGVDVLNSEWLKARFSDTRNRLIAEIQSAGQPSPFTPGIYADLSHLLAIQFGKRLISLVRDSGHGGTVVFFPDERDGWQSARKWILMKYASPSERIESTGRYRALVASIMERLAEMAPPGAPFEKIWDLYTECYDRQLDELEESFFELARFYADFMQVDGALILDKSLQVLGFGGEIVADRNVAFVMNALDAEGTQKVRRDIRSEGTRHRSVYRLCSVDPETFGFVVSQDGTIRAIAHHNDNVTVWDHAGI